LRRAYPNYANFGLTQSVAQHIEARLYPPARGTAGGRSISTLVGAARVLRAESLTPKCLQEWVPKDDRVRKRKLHAGPRHPRTPEDQESLVVENTRLTQRVHSLENALSKMPSIDHQIMLEKKVRRLEQALGQQAQSEERRRAVSLAENNLLMRRALKQLGFEFSSGKLSALKHNGLNEGQTQRLVLAESVEEGQVNVLPKESSVSGPESNRPSSPSMTGAPSIGSVTSIMCQTDKPVLMCTAGTQTKRDLMALWNPSTLEQAFSMPEDPNFPTPPLKTRGAKNPPSALKVPSPVEKPSGTQPPTPKNKGEPDGVSTSTGVQTSSVASAQTSCSDDRANQTEPITNDAGLQTGNGLEPGPYSELREEFENWIYVKTALQPRDRTFIKCLPGYVQRFLKEKDVGKPSKELTDALVAYAISRLQPSDAEKLAIDFVESPERRFEVERFNGAISGQLKIAQTCKVKEYAREQMNASFMRWQRVANLITFGHYTQKYRGLYYNGHITPGFERGPSMGLNAGNA
jgi:hypothetical protein